MDGPTPGSVDGGRAVFDELWRATMPPPVTGDDDPGDVDVAVLQPDANGVVWRCVTYRPWAEVEAELLANPEGISAGGRFDGGGAMEHDEPGWHTTDTLDFGMVVSGEIDLDLDDGTHHLKAGDAVVQRATRHAWRNRTDEPAVMAFVLISRASG
jgi:mannose-6-phosphate isomerase-like protein (cupin superfamily)